MSCPRQRATEGRSAARPIVAQAALTKSCGWSMEWTTTTSSSSEPSTMLNPTLDRRPRVSDDAKIRDRLSTGTAATRKYRPFADGLANGSSRPGAVIGGAKIEQTVRKLGGFGAECGVRAGARKFGRFWAEGPCGAT